MTAREDVKALAERERLAKRWRGLAVWGPNKQGLHILEQKHKHRWIKSFFHQWCKCGARRPGT